MTWISRLQILWYNFTTLKLPDTYFTPSQSLPAKQESTSSSSSRYINNSFGVYLFLNSKLSNGGMKVEAKRAFKSYLLSPKKHKKVDRLCMKFSSPSNVSVQRCLYCLFQNQRPYFLLLHLFWRISQPSGQDQQNCKRTYCWLPT